MNQADVSKLISQLKIKVNPRHRNLKNIDGPEGRLLKLRKTVTALFKHERIELNSNRADEARGYAERLISEARRHGDCHRTTMELVDFWLLEKQLVHKLFKVLVPRFQNCNVSYTRMYRAPQSTGMAFSRAVLELRGNPYPSLRPDMSGNRSLLHNILLDEARKEYRAQKYSGMAEKLASVPEDTQVNSQESSVLAALPTDEVQPTCVSEDTNTGTVFVDSQATSVPGKSALADDAPVPPQERKETKT